MDNFEPVKPEEYQRLMAILKTNASKTFVQRILRPDEFPHLDIGNGMRATHRMSTVEQNGKHYAFPTILYDGKGLVDYSQDWRTAFDKAQASGNVIEFDSPYEAEWFSKRYKGAWGGQMNKPPQ
jgi:hypothetical protein